MRSFLLLLTNYKCFNWLANDNNVFVFHIGYKHAFNRNVNFDKVLDFSLRAFTHSFDVSVNRSGQAHWQLESKFDVVVAGRTGTGRELVHRLPVVQEFFLHSVTLTALNCAVTFLLGPVAGESRLFFTFHFNFNVSHDSRFNNANHHETFNPVSWFVEGIFRLNIDVSCFEKAALI